MSPKNPKYQIGDVITLVDDRYIGNSEIMEVNVFNDKEISYKIKTGGGFIFKKFESEIFCKILRSPKYKIGDRVIFYFTENEVMIGYIEGIRKVEIQEDYLYNIICGDSIFFIDEKSIIAKSEIQTKKENQLEEFKEGEEVWVKAKVSPWDGVYNNGLIIINGNISVSINSHGGGNILVKKCYILKSLPKKNEWVSVKEKWPSHKQRVHLIYIPDEEKNAKITHTGFYDAKWKQFNIPYHNLEREKVTHWKPLDALPTE